MDERDLRILMAIASLGTGNVKELHEETGIPTSTIHYRIEKLKENGIIRNDLLDIDIQKAGLKLTLISDVVAEYGELTEGQVGEKLANIEGVNKVYFTLGDVDFVLIAHLTNRDMVHRLVNDFESIPEVSRVSSKFVIMTIKDEPNPLNDYSLESLR
ncbi:Lrp/AsnC family transcriptional regulator [Natrarchaeobius sp. A-rgal3]|uniref:Lrp/AsnC family transcriptional regulator n=1 Tax=Natrarchaeobius versutus TaxID=1679078 RepID=UPI00350F739B